MDPYRLQFDQWARELSAELYRFAYWLCRDPAQAQDLVQEAFVRAWRARTELRDPRAAKAWLMTIVRREHARLYERVQPELTDLDALPIEDAAQPSAESLGDTELVRAAIARIELKYRTPLLLQVIGGFSCEEIAEQLGISSGAVMTQLFRARAKLKALLDPAADGRVYELA